jgi:hypothetical protein
MEKIRKDDPINVDVCIKSVEGAGYVWAYNLAKLLINNNLMESERDD